MRQNPLTGAANAFDVCGKNFCGTIAAGQEILAFRSASVGFQEVSRDSGSFWFPEVRPSCWISVVPAGGLILAPEGYSTCICPYNYKTSLALVPVERYEDWSIYLTGRKDKRINRNSQHAAPQVIKTLRLNLNAPGDRMDADGHVWLAYPRPIEQTRYYFDTELSVQLKGVEESFRHNADLHPITGTPEPWLFTSGVEGAVNLSVELPGDQQRSYSVRLLFAETEDAAPSERVFDVEIQGAKVLQKFDIAETAGTNSADIRQFDGIDASGTMTIQLVPVRGKPPRICSLMITEAAD